MKERITDTDYLRRFQYKDATNLDHRAALHQRFSTNPQGWLSWVFEQLEMDAGATILEIGCGPGFLWDRNATEIDATWQLHLSDLSHGMIREARRRLSALRIRYFISLDAQSLPYCDVHFDGVIANHMLYHASNVRQALAEIRRVLRPGAKAYAGTNGSQHLKEMAQLVSEAKAEQAGETAETFSKSIRGFDLETGPKLMKEFYSLVDVRRYDDSLLVTDAEAIVRYVQSSPTLRLSVSELVRLRAALRKQMDKQGAIKITKEPVLIVGTKPNGA